MNDLYNIPDFTTKSSDPSARYKTILNKFGIAHLKKLFHKPVFIISAPRSGSTLLFESLSRIPDFWTLGEECHTIYRSIPSLDPQINNFDSSALTRKQATPEVGNIVRAGFALNLFDHTKMRFMQRPDDDRPDTLRFLEKTPRNSLNIPFLDKIFPDAHYIFLMREPASNINSIIEAWNVGLQDGSFVTFKDLKGWDRRHWCMLLPPGWRDLNAHSLAEIAAFQWQSCNEIIMQDLQKVPGIRKACIRYEDLVANPDKEIGRLVKFAHIKVDQDYLKLTNNKLPLSKTTISQPDPDKWKNRFDVINPLLPKLESTNNKLNLLHKNQMY